MALILKLSRKMLIILSFVVTGCLEPYNPPEIKNLGDILVVDGFINASDSSGTVRLSEATPLSEDRQPIPVTNASVQIEDENGSAYALNETSQGNYSATRMDLDPSKRYRLLVQTRSDKLYYSEFIELRYSPPIDSITWHPTLRNDGIEIFVNTHDESGNTEYYQWTFEETWEYRSRYGAFYKVENGNAVPNPIDINRCYIGKPSTEIYVASSSALASDVIRNFPLIFIPVKSQKVSIKYSILVQQRSLTKEAYDFWVALKKSTESLGSLFDPLPSQVLGNMYSQNDPSEPVLGYFSGGRAQEKRIFIRLQDLPKDLRIPPVPSCPIDSILNMDIRNTPDMFLINSYGSPFPLGFTTSAGKNCMDCRDDGGSLVRPDFWK